MRPVPSISRFLPILWNRLTEPSQALDERADRYLARLLASLLLLLIVVALIGLGRAFLLPPGVRAVSFIASLMAGVLFIVCYWLARSARFRRGAIVMVATMSCVVLIQFVLTGKADQLGVLNYLVIPVAFGGLFLADWVAALNSLLNLGMIALAGLTTPGISFQIVLTGPFFFVTATTLALWITVYYLSRFEAERRTEALASAARYERQAQEMTLLHQARAALARQLDLSTLMNSIVEAVADTYGYALVGLYMVEGSDLVLRHQVGYERVLARVSLSSGIMARVVRTGQPVLVEDVRREPDFIEAIPGIESEVCVPLFDEGRCVGVLNVESRDRLTEQDLRLMTALSDHLGVAIGRARLYTSLRESQQQIRLVADNIADIITRIDAAGIVSYISPSIMTVLGFKPERCIGLTIREWLEWMHPDDREWMWADFERFLQGSQAQTFEYRYCHADGHYLWIENVGRPLLDDAGRFQGAIFVSRDITARKQAEDALRESEARLRAIVENTPDGIFIKDREGRVGLVNPAGARLMGRPLAELIGQTEDLISGAEVGARIRAEDQWVMETGQPHFKDVTQLVDGEERTVHVMKFPYRSDTGEIIGVIGVSRNITERKRAEETLRENQRFIERIADASPHITYVYDLVEQRNVYSSREIAKVLGYGPHEIQAMGDQMFARILHPDELPRLAERLTRFATAADDDILESEIRFVDAQGQTHCLYFRETIFARNADGTPRQVLGTATDITERKRAEQSLQESEARYRLVTELAPISIAVIGLDGKVLYINAVGARLLGGESPQDIIGRSAYDFLPPESLAKLTPRIEALHGGTPTPPAETTVIRLDGQPVEVEVRSMPLQYGGQMAVLSIMQDVAARKEAERQRRELTAERERTATLRRLIGDISHDLKTPLTSMRLRYDLLTRAADDDTRQRNLVVFGSQLSYLEQQVQNLITLWRLDSADQTVFRFAPVDINRLVQQVAVEQEPLALARSQVLTVKLGADLPTVRGDADQLHRVITHVLVNALNYTPDEGQITMRTLVDEAVVIEVRDSGIGIAPEDLERIFDPFYRADRARGIDSGGMGLGLAIALRVVEAHGGTITVESALGQGSTFRIHLPLDPLT